MMVRRAALPLVFLMATLASAVLVSVMASHNPIRLDVTATGTHQLSDRAELILDRLDSGWELVLAANLRAIDPGLRRDVEDVLDVFDKSSEAVDATIIDTGSGSGVADFAALLERLAERERGAIDAQAATIQTAAVVLSQVGAAGEELSNALLAVGAAIPADAHAAAANKQFFETRAAAARLITRDLVPVLDAVGAALDVGRVEPIGPVRVPRVDRAASVLAQPMDAIESQLSSLTRELDRFGAADVMPEETREMALSLSRQIRPMRDRVALEADRLKRLPTPDLLRVARALRGGEAMIVVGPAGVTAIDLGTLLPDPAILESLGLRAADVRRRTEELITTALGSLVLAEPPVVVLTHGEAQRFLDTTPLFNEIRQRLSMRGIDVVEWAAAIEPDPPSLVAVDPTGSRPVVYATMAPDSSAGSQRDGDSSLNGVRRTQLWVEALLSVIDRGKPVLLTLNPSIMPGFGETDPQERLLERFGVSADTGRPILQERLEQGVRLVDQDLPIVPGSAGDSASHPIANAINGQRVLMPWPVAIDISGQPGAQALLTIQPDGSTWAESQWLRLAQTPRDQRRLLDKQPEFDAGDDSRDGPWVVAAAIEAEGVAAEGGTSRMVVVGSNNFHIDPVTQQAALVDGRAVALNPGNLELFEASVYWLAGQEDLIATSARAGSTPTIKALSDRDLALVRGFAAFGPALLVLILGGLWRFFRG